MKQALEAGTVMALLLAVIFMPAEWYGFVTAYLIISAGLFIGSKALSFNQTDEE